MLVVNEREREREREREIKTNKVKKRMLFNKTRQPKISKTASVLNYTRQYRHFQ